MDFINVSELARPESPLQGSPLISEEGGRIALGICNFIVSTLICLFGTATNVINIIVFISQGFQDFVNYSLLGISIADMCSCLTRIGFNIGNNPYFQDWLPSVILFELQYMIAGGPTIYLSTVSCALTVFIAFERCLCVTVPLKVKDIISPRITVATILAIYILVQVTKLPIYTTCYIGWKFDAETNRSLLGLIMTPAEDDIDEFDYLITVFLQFFLFVAITGVTTVLVIMLRKKAKWRQTAAQTTAVAKQTTNKNEDKTVKMVVVIALVMIVCFCPGCFLMPISAFMPELTLNGRYERLLFLLWSLIFTFGALNATVNIFIYYHLSSKYRNTFNSIFRGNSLPK